jgi:tocopherol cyclase
MSILYPIAKLWQPVIFQGGSKNRHYFEGWYFKNVATGGQHIWSVIPGVSIENRHNRHAFIQLINGKTAQTWYIKFPFGSFSYSKNDFSVSIADNHFSYKGFTLNINSPENQISAKGKIDFRAIHRLKSNVFNPGIMGWYSFVPFMECNHGLVSMDHSLTGELEINSERVDFSGGRGYSEKDWGRSMPSAWIWMQSNHFVNQSGISFMLSVAKIPWLGRSFTGFLCVLLFNGKIIRLATYTGAKLKNIHLDREMVSVEIESREHIIIVKAKHAARGLLAAPVNGAMDRRIAESVDAIINLEMKDRTGKIIFSGTGNTAGLELVGDMAELPV